MTRRLVLLGGGHAHLQVLARLARQPLPGWELLLVTPQPRQLYSGMLPGWVAGHYALQQIGIDLQPLARAAGATLVLDAATALAAGERCIALRAGGRIAFDVLSIDVGSAPAPALPGAAQHGIGVRPLEAFAAAWEALAQRLRVDRRPFHALVLGAGPGGVELACALRHRARTEGWRQVQVRLVGAEPMPLPAAPSSAQRRIAALLRRQGIHWDGGRRAVALESAGLRFEDGSVAAADSCWIVTGAAAPAWLTVSGLATDDAGFVQVGATLQSVSHPNVFVAGDAASHRQDLPRSGVYALRSGAALGRNLHAFCTGGRLAGWQPQARALVLVSTGDRRALAIWGPWSAAGRWAWLWKDWIDRRFVASWPR